MRISKPQKKAIMQNNLNLLHIIIIDNPFYNRNTERI